MTQKHTFVCAHNMDARTFASEHKRTQTHTYVHRPPHTELSSLVNTQLPGRTLPLLDDGMFLRNGKIQGSVNLLCYLCFVGAYKNLPEEECACVCVSKCLCVKGFKGRNGEEEGEGDGNG